MKKLLCWLLAALLLAGCAGPEVPQTEPPVTEATEIPTEPATQPPTEAPREAGQIRDAVTEYASRFDAETVIVLSDTGITVDGGAETEGVFTSHDIIYYESRESYDSGNPYGEGTGADMHTAWEAEKHTVVNITAPGAYRVTGKLSAGQLRIDLGEEASGDPEAVVELILDNADITCTVAPAILFLNTYECDGGWSVETARADVDTSAAGANLILQGKNAVSGSYVAKIYKDSEGEKKLWKQDGAIYSYQSLNVFGPGALTLTAANEGLDTELHLTVLGGDILIRSQNDGINTNEDGVSVTTIHGGNLRIIAGLGQEGDGIDSNGYLVIRGGTVVSAANPAADAGLDSDLGSYIHGGTVLALGSAMDWAESDSGQVTMNLQFAQAQSGALTVTRMDGTVVFAYDPAADETLGTDVRPYRGAILSCPSLRQGDNCQIYTGGQLSGQASNGLYVMAAGLEGGTRMGYTGTDVTMGFGGPGPEMPGGMEPPQGMEMPEGMEPPQGMEPPEAMEKPEDHSLLPDRKPGDFEKQPGGQMQPPDQGSFGDRNRQNAGEANGVFYLQDMVNFFSGLTALEIHNS